MVVLGRYELYVMRFHVFWLPIFLFWFDVKTVERWMLKDAGD